MSPGWQKGGEVNGRALAGIAVAALLVAVLGVFLLAPDQGPPTADIEAASRVVADRFSQTELDRADQYRSKARLIAVGGILAQFALLALLAFRRGPSMRKLLALLGRRPLLGAAAMGAGVAALVAVVGLPFELAAWQLGRDYGLSVQTLGPRLNDWLIGSAIAVLLAAVGAFLAMVLWRWLRGRFWVAGAVLIGLWAVVSTWLWPVLVSPLFNEFKTLPDGSARDQVIRLADRAGVEVGEIYVVDASRRSSTVNAYVNGIGSSKRVVLYDNAMNGLDSDEFRVLLAHELGHVKDRDLHRGLTFALLVIPLAVLFVQFASKAIMRRKGDDPTGPAFVLTLALMATLTAFILQIPGNALSRAVEAKADRTAIALSGDPQGLVDLQVRLAKANLSDVDPPAIWHFVFGTHPSTLDRIAIAEGARR